MVKWSGDQRVDVMKRNASTPDYFHHATPESNTDTLIEALGATTLVVLFALVAMYPLVVLAVVATTAVAVAIGRKLSILGRTRRPREPPEEPVRD